MGPSSAPRLLTVSFIIRIAPSNVTQSGDPASCDKNVVVMPTMIVPSRRILIPYLYVQSDWSEYSWEWSLDFGKRMRTKWESLPPVDERRYFLTPNSLIWAGKLTADNILSISTSANPLPSSETLMTVAGLYVSWTDFLKRKCWDPSCNILRWRDIILSYGVLPVATADRFSARWILIFSRPVILANGWFSFDGSDISSCRQHKNINLNMRCRNTHVKLQSLRSSIQVIMNIFTDVDRLVAYGVG